MFLKKKEVLFINIFMKMQILMMQAKKNLEAAKEKGFEFCFYSCF